MRTYALRRLGLFIPTLILTTLIVFVLFFLVPGDAALDTNDCDVAVTGMYCGQRRMTLSYPIINRARRILWMITGASKSDMLNRLIQADINIPAGRVRQRRATIIADAAALSG